MGNIVKIYEIIIMRYCLKTLKTNCAGLKALAIEECEIVCVPHIIPEMEKPKIRVEVFGYKDFTEAVRQHFIKSGFKSRAFCFKSFKN